MARKWSGFLPQNAAVKEEWTLLEACEAKSRAEEGLSGMDIVDTDFAQSSRRLLDIAEKSEEQK